MSRNEQAEQTYQKILTVSSKLFRKQGYTKTSIQDILNELKMSKGALYYHFKSKKEILEAVEEHALSQKAKLLTGLIEETKAKNAKEKLAKVLLKFFELADFSTNAKEIVLLDMEEDAHSFVVDLRGQLATAELFVPIFEAGVRDGSIETEYPLELAEITFMLFNTWLNPVLFNRNFEQTNRRFKFYQQALGKLGADFLSDELVDKMMANFKNLGYFE